MTIIEQDELAVFRQVLESHHLAAADFAVAETDTTDPKTDEVEGITGFVVVTRRSTHRSREYPLGTTVSWVEKFTLDVANDKFGMPGPSEIQQQSP